MRRAPRRNCRACAPRNAASNRSGIYPALVEFEAGLAQLAADPLDPSYREVVLENARTIAATFSLAVQGIESGGDQIAFAAQDGVDRLNVLAGELARTNTNIARSRDGSVANAALLDQRDALLRDMSGLAGIETAFDGFGRASVRLADGSGPLLVDGDRVQQVSMNRAADGTIAFASGGAAVAIGAGKLAGQAQALDRMASLRADLDSVANDLMARVNGAQANGVTPSGASGQPMFAGTGAGDLAVIASNGSDIATAPDGQPAEQPRHPQSGGIAKRARQWRADRIARQRDLRPVQPDQRARHYPRCAADHRRWRGGNARQRNGSRSG